MGIIDSDTHVIETEHTWDFMEESEEQFRPVVLVPKGGGETQTRGFTGASRPLTVQEFWLIEGRATQKRSTFKSVETSNEQVEMTDIQSRLAHMDELGVDVHVLYPTIFLSPKTRRPEVEVALFKSYNRWMAEIWAQAPDRFKWAAMLPYMSLDISLEEMHWAKDHGARACFMHSVEGERRLSDPYFDPIYREASSLDLPMCIHAASGNFALFDLYAGDAGFSTFKLPVVGAFHDLLMKGTPAKFPDLRWGFVEVSAQWLPYALNDMELRFRKGGREWLGRDILKENNMYVACQTADDLTTILECVGEDNIVIGSDYGHNDTSSEIEALRRIREKGDVPDSVVDKILDDNARALYAL
jgi:predicted TIM-barrel fold metal-dependent hydrolase